MWKPEKLGLVVAERELTLVSRSGGDSTVTVRLGTPVKGPEDIDPWWSPVSIEWPNEVQFEAAAGEDAFQAIQLSMYLLTMMLPDWARQRGGKLRYLDGPDLGFNDVARMVARSRAQAARHKKVKSPGRAKATAQRQTKGARVKSSKARKPKRQ